MTDEERTKIVKEVIEQILIRIPDVLGNLMSNHAQMNKLNNIFYSKYPEFKKHRRIVASVMESIEGDRPLSDYSDILKEAVPKIQKFIETSDKVDTTTVDKPSLDFDNGVI